MSIVVSIVVGVGVGFGAVVGRRRGVWRRLEALTKFEFSNYTAPLAPFMFKISSIVLRQQRL
jgi:hypothetical protein